MHLESLEPRILASVTYQNHILTIVGSPRRDRIRLGISIDSAGNGFGLVINGHRRTLGGLNPTGLEPREIHIQSRAGNDSIKVDLWMSFARITLDGGIGDDHIDIHGVMDGQALLRGGDGNDSLSASPPGGFRGDDHTEMHGDDGNDTLIGGSGDEKLFGDAGNDLLKGGDGIDTYFGGPGNDRIYSADANADEPGDGGPGFDRAFFSDDCAAPIDNLGVEKLLTMGTGRTYFCWI